MLRLIELKYDKPAQLYFSRELVKCNNAREGNICAGPEVFHRRPNLAVDRIQPVMARLAYQDLFLRHSVGQDNSSNNCGAIAGKG